MSDFDADLHEEARSKRKLSYGEHRAVLDDVGKRVWVLVKGFSLSYHNKEAFYFTTDSLLW